MCRRIVKVMMEEVDKAVIQLHSRNTSISLSLCIVSKAPLPHSFVRWNFKEHPLIHLRVQFISSSWMHITSLCMTFCLVGGTWNQNKTTAASHVFLSQYWFALVMPTAPSWLLISFSTFYTTLAFQCCWLFHIYCRQIQNYIIGSKCDTVLVFC